MKIIINADDFGKNAITNSAIVEAFNKGLITNTTIMTNMEAYDDAVLLAKKNCFFDKVGLHLNIFEGSPLIKNVGDDPFFIRNGKLVNNGLLRKNFINKFIVPKKTKIAIRNELNEQIIKYINEGFTELHMDSHGHSHTLMPVYKEILKTSHGQKFKSIRLSLNFMEKRKSLLINIYKKIYNNKISKKFITTNYFTSATEFIKIAQKKYNNFSKKVEFGRLDCCTCEIMVHPSYQNDKLINKGGSDFEELFKYINKSDLISYSDLITKK